MPWKEREVKKLRYEFVLRALSEGIAFKEKEDLVRGLDYYTGNIFEVICPSLGAQDAIAAGGRYDGLSADMGGPETGATGYAIGVERLILAAGDSLKPEDDIDGVFIVYMDKPLKKDAFSIMHQLRKKGITADMDLSDKSFKAQMRKANKYAWKYVAIIGEDEIKDKKILLKEMSTGEQNSLAPEDAAEYLKKAAVEK